MRDTHLPAHRARRQGALARRLHVCVLLTAALACGCSDTGNQTAPGAPGEGSEAPARQTPARQTPAPKPPAPSPAPAIAQDAQATAVGTQPAVEMKPEIRFDMTQGGEAQDAEAFDAWMRAQGVQVAEGASPAGAADASEGGEAQAPARDAKATSTGSDETGR